LIHVKGALGARPVRSRVVARLALLALLALVFAGCSRPAAPREHVKVGVSVLRISQPVFVAHARGLFAARGLDVELQRFDTAQPFADELAAGRLDAAGYVALPILFAREGGAPPVKLATAILEDDAHPLSFLLVPKNSALDGVAGLRGRTIGILPTVAYRRWLLAVLEREGLGAEDVTIANTPPQQQAAALAGGGIDALFTGDPMATAALTRGGARVLREGAEVPRALGAPFVFGSFAISQDLVRDRPAAAAALVGALDEAIALIDADPAAGRDALAAQLREGERALAAFYPPTRYARSTEADALWSAR